MSSTSGVSSLYIDVSFGLYGLFVVIVGLNLSFNTNLYSINSWFVALVTVVVFFLFWVTF